MSASTTGAIAVMADPTRTRILRLIRESAHGRAQVGHLAEVLSLRQPTVSHHMKALRAEGLVDRTPEGRRVWYSLSAGTAERLDALLGPGDDWASEPDLGRIVDDLSTRFAGVFSRATVAAHVSESRELLSAAGQSPLISSRTAVFAATRLEALSAARRVGARDRPEVLFVCVQNAGRSQLAAAVLRHLAADRVSVRTAGSAPGAEVRSAIVRSLDEIGVSIGGEFPKPLTDEVVRAADVVVTMGCGDACPVYPGRRYLDWQLEDPVGKSADDVRAIRDEIDRRVRALLSELLPG